jgi:glycerol-3-phosphate dehydrogenase (NAD(P)+)
MALARLLPGAEGNLAILSGPSFAVELVRGDPTAAVVASRAPGVAQQAQDILSGGTFRLYTNQDPTGVELAGALKNVMALAAGVVTGLGLGANTMAALITRGLAEMSRLGLRMGGQPSTFGGLAGLGDLVLTCTSSLSRNHRVGCELGRGRSLQEILKGMRMVAEGVPTTRAALQLAGREGVEMPIVEQMHDILFAGQAPRRALDELLAREPRRESDPAGAQAKDVAGV